MNFSKLLASLNCPQLLVYVSMVVCLFVALQQTADLSRVYPALGQQAAGKWHWPHRNPDAGEDGWMYLYAVKENKGQDNFLSYATHLLTEKHFFLKRNGPKLYD